MIDVILRRASAADAETLFRIRNEPSANRFQPLRPYSLDTLRRILAQRAEKPLNASFDGKAEWIVLAGGSDAGWITLDVVSREHGVGTIGYTIAEAWRGRGVGTNAVRDVIARAFDPRGLDLERLEAVAAKDNAASRAVLLKAGFQEEGVARGYLVIRGERIDHARYGMLRTDL